MIRAGRGAPAQQFSSPLAVEKRDTRRLEFTVISTPHPAVRGYGGVYGVVKYLLSLQ